MLKGEKLLRVFISYLPTKRLQVQPMQTPASRTPQTSSNRLPERRLRSGAERCSAGVRVGVRAEHGGKGPRKQQAGQEWTKCKSVITIKYSVGHRVQCAHLDVHTASKT